MPVRPGSGFAAALVGAALALAGAGRASAEPRPRVVVVVSPDATGRTLAERVRAELDTMGFEARSPSSSAGALAAITEREDAAAAVEIILASGQARVTFFDRQTARTQLHALARPPSPALAIQIAEALRAWLLNAPAPPLSQTLTPAPTPTATQTQTLSPRQAPPPTPTPTPTLTPTPPPTIEAQRPPARPPVAGAEVGLGLIASPGGLPPVAALALAAGFFVSPRVRVGALGLIPLASMRHEAPEGSSQTRATILALDVRGELRGSAWRASLGAGAAAAVLSTDGRAASALYTDQTATRVTPGAYVRPGALYVFRRELVLRADLAVGWQARPFALVYAGREAARWGAPWLAGWISLETRFP